MVGLPRPLQIALVERGGPLRALGYIPGVAERGIPRGGGGGGFPLGPSPIPAAAVAALITAACPECSPAAAAAAAAILSIAGGLLTGSMFAGRPRNAATIEIGARLAANANPFLASLGREIVALGREGYILSSRADIQRRFAPLVARAVRELEANGYPPSVAEQLVRDAVFNPQAPIAAAPVLPPPVLPPGRVGAPAAPRPGYRIVTPPAEFGTIPQAQAAALPTPYEAAVAPGVPRAILDRYPWLRKAFVLYGIEQAGTAVEKLLKGENLDNEEFGALAGTLIGALAGPEGALAGSQIGVEVGVAVDTLDEIAHHYLGQSLDELLSAAPRAALNLLRGQPAAPVSPPPPLPSPQPTTTRELAPPPFPELPPPTPARQRPIPQLPPPIIAQPPSAPPCPGCPPPEPTCQDESSPIGQLAKQLVNCPTFQNELRDKLRIRQRPGEKPSLEVAQPICLCCDSVDDLEQYVSSGGARGRCTQVAAADASMLALK